MIAGKAGKEEKKVETYKPWPAVAGSFELVVVQHLG